MGRELKSLESTSSPSLTSTTKAPVVSSDPHGGGADSAKSAADRVGQSNKGRRAVAGRRARAELVQERAKLALLPCGARPRWWGEHHEIAQHHEDRKEEVRAIGEVVWCGRDLEERAHDLPDDRNERISDAAATEGGAQARRSGRGTCRACEQHRRVQLQQDERSRDERGQIRGKLGCRDHGVIGSSPRIRSLTWMKALVAAEPRAIHATGAGTRTSVRSISRRSR
jgi:hypothetical protein